MSDSPLDGSVAGGDTPIDLGEVADVDLPVTLARLHRRHGPGALVTVRSGHGRGGGYDQWFDDAVVGAGFTVEGRQSDGSQDLIVLRRLVSLPDTVGPEMSVLVCGLNPSPAAAEDGVGFARPGNRFWPAAREAGLVSRDRDPDHALVEHGIGMTDLVKRTTRRADELEPVEYRHGLARVGRLATRLRPGIVCFVGLAGYRIAVDRRATAGLTDETLGGRPVYLMPSTSGLNAHARLDDFVEHFSVVIGLASR